MKKTNIIKFPKNVELNIGLITFFIIGIYVLFHMFHFLTSNHVTIYEVNAGTIASNRTYQAVAIRQEEIINAADSGTIYYYARNMDQIGVRTNVYSIDTSGKITGHLTEENADTLSLSDLDQDQLENAISGFLFSYDNNSFQKVYQFKSDLSASLQQYYSSSMINQLSDELAAAQQQGVFTFYTAPKPGIVVYQLDGYEDLTIDNVSSETLHAGQPEQTDLKAQTKISEGQPAYKLITSDHWTLVTEIEEELARRLATEDIRYIHLRFLLDMSTTWADCSVMEKSGVYYLVLSLDDSVNRFADTRFLQIELLLNEESGLKIPNSAIVSKEFFTIPKSYAFLGNDSTEPGFLLHTKNGNELINPTIFYETEDFYYVDDEKLADGDILGKADSGETYQVGKDTASLSGVYSVNKGYAVFKRIEPIYQNEDYTIIKTGTSYGIALYDHIALQGQQVTENAIIH